MLLARVCRIGFLIRGHGLARMLLARICRIGVVGGLALARMHLGALLLRRRALFRLEADLLNWDTKDCHCHGLIAVVLVVHVRLVVGVVLVLVLALVLVVGLVVGLVLSDLFDRGAELEEARGCRVGRVPRGTRQR